jgi:hypothetical protein
MGLRICHIEHLFADFLGNIIFFGKYAEEWVAGFACVVVLRFMTASVSQLTTNFSKESVNSTSTCNKRNHHCHGDSLEFHTLAITLLLSHIQKLR